ncbi:hypothetical protein EGW08_000487 [Elysia chlorotica]|uniref:Uncharacterized protein n=1 Tax=Elysia chlorotica TaxID=188477 RepID=A0A433UDB0_ELYCH|nr:hypothetical protein EGW08_000487 [Elysia chlorotica]
MLNPPTVKSLPLRTDGCWAANLTTEVTSVLLNTTTAAFSDSTTLSASGEGGSSRLYLSYQHYSTLTLLVSVVVACLVSLITGRNNKQVVDPRTYIHYSWSSLNSDTLTTYDLNDSSGSSSDEGKGKVKDLHRGTDSEEDKGKQNSPKIFVTGVV